MSAEVSLGIELKDTLKRKRPLLCVCWSSIGDDLSRCALTEASRDPQSPTGPRRYYTLLNDRQVLVAGGGMRGTYDVLKYADDPGIWPLAA